MRLLLSCMLFSFPFLCPVVNGYISLPSILLLNAITIILPSILLSYRYEIDRHAEL